MLTLLLNFMDQPLLQTTVSDGDIDMKISVNRGDRNVKISKRGMLGDVQTVHNSQGKGDMG